MNTVQMSLSGEKHRTEIQNLLLYFTGKGVSVFGTAIYQFALGLYVLKLTGSALSFAVTLILGIIPMIIINPFAGVIADKFNKKKLVVSMDLLNGMLLLLVYLLSHIYGLTLILIYATTFLMTVFTTFFGVGLESAKPNIVSDRMLMNINSISRIMDSVSSIMGPMLGGVVFALFDIRTFIIINGLSFILSGVSMLFINFKLFQQQLKEEKQVEKIQFMKDIKDGFQYLMGRKKILNLFLLLISLNFFLSFALTVPVPYIINTVLELESKEFGMIQAAFPIGMILGALIVKKITEKITYAILLKFISFSLSALMIISGIPVLLHVYLFNPIIHVIFYSVVMFVVGFVVALIDIPFSYIIQKEIPDEYRGRVLSIGMSIGKTMVPLAMLSAGVLLNLIPAYFIPVVGGLLFLLLNMRSSNKPEMKLLSVKDINV
jgi:MFS family permease